MTQQQDGALTQVKPACSMDSMVVADSLTVKPVLSNEKLLSFALKNRFRWFFLCDDGIYRPSQWGFMAVSIEDPILLISKLSTNKYDYMPEDED